MANITTFATLKTAVTNVLGRTPEDAVYQMTTKDINEGLRLRSMESTTTATEAASVDLSAKSPEVLSIISIYRDTDPRQPLEPVSPQQLWKLYETSGSPRRYAFVNDTLLLDKPGSGETLAIRYFGALTLMSANDDTSDTLTTYPAIFFYGALYHHGMMVGDPRAAQWGQQYEFHKRRAVARDQVDRYSGAPLVPTRAAGTTP